MSPLKDELLAEIRKLVPVFIDNLLEEDKMLVIDRVERYLEMDFAKALELYPHFVFLMILDILREYYVDTILMIKETLSFFTENFEKIESIKLALSHGNIIDLKAYVVKDYIDFAHDFKATFFNNKYIRILIDILEEDVNTKPFRDYFIKVFMIGEKYQ